MRKLQFVVGATVVSVFACLTFGVTAFATNSPFLDQITAFLHRDLALSSQSAPTAPLSGTYNVGSGGDFATLTAAVAAYNAQGVSGPVTFRLITNGTQAGETYPIGISAAAGASATNTLTIKPATGVSPTFSGSATGGAIIQLDASASFVTIDGSNTAGGTTKDLTLKNTGASGVPSAFGLGGTSNTIKNVQLTPGTSGYGVVNTAANTNCTVENCTISSAVTYLNGFFVNAPPSSGLSIIGNTITTPTTDGINLQTANAGITIRQNSITLNGSIAKNGIEFAVPGTGAAVIDRNFISVSASAGDAKGLLLSTISGDNTTITNNQITIEPAGGSSTGNKRGIEMSGTGTESLYYNSVRVAGTDSSAGASSRGIFLNTTGTAPTVKDNIIVNVRNGAGAAPQYGMRYAVTPVSDYNDVTATGTNGIFANLNGSDKATLLAWQTSTSQDAHSLSADPLFTSATDLHISGSSPANNAGTPITGVTTDYDGETRNPTTPDMGADENPPPAPTVTNILPSSGPTAGGENIDIFGTNLIATTAVTFDGVAAPSFTPVNDTHVVVTTPAHATGNSTVAVTTPGGSASSGFYFEDAPTVVGVSQNSDSTAGGATITINGTNFVNASSVTFGGTAASFVFINASQISATAPAHTAGTVSIDVTTPSGSNAPNTLFTYIQPAPTVTTTAATSVTLNSATLNGIVNPNGNATTGYFLWDTSNVACSALSNKTADQSVGNGSSNVSLTQALTGLTPLTNYYFCTVATNSGGTTFGSVQTFQTNPAAPSTPVITGSNPPSPNNTSTTPTISGTSSVGSTTINLYTTNNCSGSPIATGDGSTGTWSITNVPVGANTTTTIFASATNVSGTSGCSSGFAYTNDTIPPAAPVITGSNPASPNTSTSPHILGTAEDGSTVKVYLGSSCAGTLKGTGTATGGNFDIAISGLLSNTRTFLTAQATDLAGNTGACSNVFEYDAYAQPTVTSISPASGPAAGGTSVTVTGANFSVTPGETTVAFGGVAATNVSVSSSTQLTATSPAGTGTVDVTVTTPGGTSATSANDQFTYIAPTYQIAGTVNYGVGTTPKVVPRVGVTATGTSGATTSTDLSGNYSLTGFPGGSYTVTPSKTGDVNGITAFDATVVLRDVAAGGTTLTPNQRIAADTNGNAAVTGFDAAQILRYVAAGGVTSQTGSIESWVFNPASRSYPSLTGSLAGENYDGMLKGEVNGSWTQPTSFASFGGAVEEEVATDLPGVTIVPATQVSQSAEKASGGAAQVDGPSVLTPMTISLPASTTAAMGSTVTIPVTLSNPGNNDIADYSFAVLFDQNVLVPASPAISTVGTMSAPFTVVSDANTPGRLGIAASGANSINGAGTLINLRFTVVGNAPATTNLTFNSVLFEEPINGDPIPTTPTNGSFTVQSTTAAAVTVSGRVLAPGGGGLRNASVVMTDTNGVTRRVVTNAFGSYTFTGVQSGGSYIMGVESRRFTYATRVVQVHDSLAGVDFSPQ